MNYGVKMTIYILDSDPKKTAAYLDDKSLDSMIRDIAQVLCNVHHYIALTALYYPSESIQEACDKIPLDDRENKTLNAWTEWTIQARANYMWLVQLGLELSKEWNCRFSKPLELNKPVIHKIHKSIPVISWTRDNVPDLPSGYPCPDSCHKNDFNQNHFKFYRQIPLVMPKKYTINCIGKCSDPDVHIIVSYRNYYQAKLKQRYIKRGLILDSKKFLESEIKWTNREIPEWIKL